MNPEEELRMAVTLEVEAFRLHERSRTAAGRVSSIMLRFRALWLEEVALRLRKRARGRSTPT